MACLVEDLCRTNKVDMDSINIRQLRTVTDLAKAVGMN